MLLDTSGLLAYHQGDETALSLFEAAGKTVTHSYVLSEFTTLANARGLPRTSALAFVRALLDHPLVEVVWIDKALHRKALALLQLRLDKQYSLCDAMSFVIMRERGVYASLTTDHHFEQEGFQRLL